MKLVQVAPFMALLVALPLQAAEMGSNLGNVRGGDFGEAHGIIGKKCTVCHSGQRIDAALAAKKDMLNIQREMEKRGAELSTSERDVLGIYWKERNPLKPPRQ